MSGYSNQISMLSIATYSAATASVGFNLAEYLGGTLVFHLRSMSGTGARVYPTWGISPDATGPTSGRYVTLRSYPTSLRATGLAALTLPATMLA